MRVTLSRGVHVLKDARTNVYNFDPFLKTLVSPDDFNFDNIAPFVSASKDTSLHSMAENGDARYVSSTSSMSATMCAIYYLLSKLRPLNLSFLSADFADEPRTFTVFSRAPAAVILQPHGRGLRSIVVEKTSEKENVLMRMGHVLEKLLTTEKKDFVRMCKGAQQPHQPLSTGAFFHTFAGDLLLRSQLDCHDPRLPRQTFDIKTRATLAVRMNVQRHQVQRRLVCRVHVELSGLQAAQPERSVRVV